MKDCGNQNLQDLLVPEKIEKSIKTLDTSGDGLIDAFEWEAIIEKALAAKLDERAKARAEERLMDISSGKTNLPKKKRRELSSSPLLCASLSSRALALFR